MGWGHEQVPLSSSELVGWHQAGEQGSSSSYISNAEAASTEQHVEQEENKTFNKASVKPEELVFQATT